MSNTSHLFANCKQRMKQFVDTPEAYSELRTSCKNSQRILSANCFRKKAPS